MEYRRHVLCPTCLTAGVHDAGTGWQCTGAGHPVPEAYVRAYAGHPAVPVTVIGRRNQGKTYFLLSLLDMINRSDNPWARSGRPFTFTAVNRAAQRALDAELSAFHEARRLQATDLASLQEPWVLRCAGVPEVGSCHLLLRDVSGEVFQHQGAALDADVYAYLLRSHTVVWTVNAAPAPTDGSRARPQELREVLERYEAILDAAPALGRAPQDIRGHQALVVVLTCGDALLEGQPELPPAARRLLADPGATAPAELSDGLRTWMGQAGYEQIVHLSERTFRSVTFAVASAFDRPPQVARRRDDPSTGRRDEWFDRPPTPRGAFAVVEAIAREEAEGRRFAGSLAWVRRALAGAVAAGAAAFAGAEVWRLARWERLGLLEFHLLRLRYASLVGFHWTGDALGAVLAALILVWPAALLVGVAAAGRALWVRLRTEGRPVDDVATARYHQASLLALAALFWPWAGTSVRLLAAGLACYLAGMALLHWNAVSAASARRGRRAHFLR